MGLLNDGFNCLLMVHLQLSVFSPVGPYYNHGSLCGFQWVHIKPYGLCGSLCGSILQPWSGVSVDLCVVPSGSMVQLWVLCATNRFRKLLLNDGVANAQTMQKIEQHVL